MLKKLSMKMRYFFFTRTKYRQDEKRLSYLQINLYNITRYRDVAQLGSALPWGGRGREFKSHRSDQIQN